MSLRPNVMVVLLSALNEIPILPTARRSGGREYCEGIMWLCALGRDTVRVALHHQCPE